MEGAVLVEDVPVPGLPAVRHPGWVERFPWVVQGTTCAGSDDEPFDLGLFRDAASPLAVFEAWDRLRAATSMPRAVHARQVHGAAVRFHREGPPGLFLADPCDGHATATPGVLLAVTVADCVPAFVVDPGARAVALVHAGWRGSAAGVLEEGVQVLVDRCGSDPADLHVHLGPAICGSCYEVGPEVFEGLGLEAPDAPAPVDLRGALASRAVAVGVPGDGISVSGRCTLCGPGGHFSHRGGDAGRQVGYLGIRG